MDDCDYVEVDINEEEVNAMDVDNIDSLNINTLPTNIASPNILADQQFEHKCLICKKNGDERLSCLSRGIDAFINHCELAGRCDLCHIISVHPDESFFLHGSCRRKLAYEANKCVKADEGVEKKTSRRLTRTLTSSFSYKEMCFLCGISVDGCVDRRKVLAGDEFDTYLKAVIRERGADDWALTVQGRLDAVIDLFAADAVYHRGCYVRFTQKLPHTPNKLKRGRPPKENNIFVFERLCDKLESECYNDIYTLGELHEMMCSIGDEYGVSDVYSKDYFKALLQQRYGDHISFSARPGRDDVVGFTNYCELLLHNKYFSDRNEGSGSESEKSVRKAAGLIMAEIRETQCDRTGYPTNDDITGDGLKFVPSLLTLFLKTLIKSG